MAASPLLSSRSSRSRLKLLCAILVLASASIVLNSLVLHHKAGKIVPHDRSVGGNSSMEKKQEERETRGGAATTTSKLRGVSREYEAYYTNAVLVGEFACLDKTQVIPSSSLNDDFCDCKDGSDEPGTSACENGRFFCENVGSKPKTISSMFVDDGVCDCCDGTDEDREVGCRNTCLGALSSKGSIEKELFEGPEFVPAARSLRNVSGSAPDYWLVVGIPTVPREVDYLTPTLAALLNELPDNFGQDSPEEKVKVVVMNNNPGNHSVFYQLKYRWTIQQKTAVAKAKHYLEFVENPGHCKDPHPELPDPDDLNNPSSRPGRQVRKQSCDLVSLIEYALGSATTSHYMFMEDDFLPCRDIVPIISYLVNKVSRLNSDWLALRFSFGMNGILMRTAELIQFKTYLFDRIAQLPPDMVYEEWLKFQRSSAKREQHIYVHNLLDHVGKISSFQGRPERQKWPRCFDNLSDAWSLPPIEKFKAKTCKHSDISPCPSKVDLERFVHAH